MDRTSAGASAGATVAPPPSGPAPHRRALSLGAGLLLSAAGTWLLLRRALTIAATPGLPGRVDTIVELTVVALGAAVLARTAVALSVATTCGALRAVGRCWTWGEQLAVRAAPSVLRAAVATALGAGLGLAGTGTALAQDVSAPSAAVPGAAVTALTWAPTTDDGPPLSWVASDPAPAAGHPATPGAEGTPGAAAAPRRTVVVAPGDSLWRIAAATLPPTADDATIAAAWPDWYDANRAVIGADPDLIRPGQALQAPPDGADR